MSNNHVLDRTSLSDIRPPGRGEVVLDLGLRDSKIYRDLEDSEDSVEGAAPPARDWVELLLQAVDAIDLTKLPPHKPQKSGWHIRKATFDFARRLQAAIRTADPSARITRELEDDALEALAPTINRLAELLGTDCDEVVSAMRYSWERVEVPCESTIWLEAVRKAKERQVITPTKGAQNRRYTLALNIVYRLQTRFYPAGVSSNSLGEALECTQQRASEILSEAVKNGVIVCVAADYKPGKLAKRYRIKHENAGVTFSLADDAPKLKMDESEPDPDYYSSIINL